MSPSRIAYVRYLNTAPLVEGMASDPSVTLIPAVPSRIAGLVRQGEADVGLASVVDAGEGLTVLPMGMIGCDGPTLTVRVFSSVPVREIRELHADTDSHTSVVLAQVVLGMMGVGPVRIRDFDARERAPIDESRASGPIEGAWPEAVLLIGDKVVCDAPPSDRYPHQMDLGEEWKRLTGLPFVYATWVCREGEERSPAVSRARMLLDRQRRRNAMRLGWIAGTRSAGTRWAPALAERYLGESLRYDLGERARDGLARFVHEASVLGVHAGGLPTFAHGGR
jgi:chorismate dehydratase